MEGIVSLLPLVAIALLFWLLIIRPASKRQKDQARMQSAVTVGEQVMLTSGIFGTVTELTDDVAAASRSRQGSWSAWLAVPLVP